MPVCSVCQSEIKEPDVYGPIHQPLCLEHWWAYLRRLENPDSEDDAPAEGAFPHDPPQPSGQNSLF
jgi:hypothetical protein